MDTFTTSEWGISSADETKNIIGKGLIVRCMIMFTTSRKCGS
jgi:hypothetical protein